MSLWIVGSQFGIYHSYEDCPGLVDTFGVEVDIMDVLGRRECPACEQRRAPVQEQRGEQEP